MNKILSGRDTGGKIMQDIERNRVEHEEKLRYKFKA
jgi:hypothetical protein